jgi:hypothetical protein
MKKAIRTLLLVSAVALGACAAPTAQDRAEMTHGRITKMVPVIIESDKAPGIGSAFAPKTANRPGQRITVLTGNGQLLEVTQDEIAGLKVGDTVRIEGHGVNAKFLPITK